MSGQEGEEPWPFQMLGRTWGSVGYDESQISEEVAYIAYHFHWPLEQILELQHSDRRRWAQLISGINERMNEEAGNLMTASGR